MAEVSKMIRAWGRADVLGRLAAFVAEGAASFAEWSLPESPRGPPICALHRSGCVDWSAHGKQRGWGGPSSAAFSQ
eukprot:10814415-Lingulodinium_polyedra.AAC.1